jgi:bla regulator protein blaR1
MIAALTNHLWQSTLFAALAALLTLALRKNRAQTRHWVWVTASMKFFVPFSLLVALGGHLNWHMTRVIAQPRLAFAIEELSQPFVAPMVSAPVAATTETGLSPMWIVAIVWACGTLAVLCHWLFRWFRIRAVLRSSATLQLEFPVPVRTSASLIEPGVFGILQPILLLPEGITERLVPEQLRAILAHELSHVHRRDNLTGFIHMLVEAVFWFHPLVWWIGTRLVDERERACDEEVLLLGSEAEVYAAGILNVCKLYVESPLACVSGVTGSNLKKRIESIMSYRIGQDLNRAKKLLLASAGVAALAGPLAIGIGHAPAIHAQTQIAGDPAKTSALAFEVASVKPHVFARGQFAFGTADRESSVRISGNRVTTQGLFAGLVMTAYKLRTFQVSGAPVWRDETGRIQLYDIEARAPGDRVPTIDEVRQMLQTLLAERFQLKFHRETKEAPTYDLVVGNNTPKLKPSAPDVESKAVLSANRLRMDYTNISISELLIRIGSQFDRPLFDKTGLQGGYDFTLEYMPTLPGGASMSPEEAAAIAKLYPPDEAPSVPVALQQQLGLKVVSAKEQVEILVIDHVERPSAN